MYGFPKAHRLLKRPEFRRVYEGGKAHRNPAFHLFVRRRDEPGPTRLGLTTTKALGGPVVRNRLRRHAREAFRHLTPRLKPGFDVVVNPGRRARDLNREEFDRSFENVLQQANLLES